MDHVLEMVPARRRKGTDNLVFEWWIGVGRQAADTNSCRRVPTRSLLGSSLWRQSRLGLGVGRCALVSSLLADSKLDVM